MKKRFINVILASIGNFTFDFIAKTYFGAGLSPELLVLAIMTGAWIIDAKEPS